MPQAPREQLPSIRCRKEQDSWWLVERRLRRAAAASRPRRDRRAGTVDAVAHGMKDIDLLAGIMLGELQITTPAATHIGAWTIYDRVITTPNRAGPKFATTTYVPIAEGGSRVVVRRKRDQRWCI